METTNQPGRKGPPLQTAIEVTEIGNGVYNFSSPPVGFQQYLVVGEEQALLIDTGIGIGSLRAAVEEITSLPVIVINTHCHPDHAGGNAEFPPAYICPVELEVYHRMATQAFRLEDLSHMPMGATFASSLQPTGPEPIGIEDGAEIDLGGRTLHILYTPGHTRGSLSVYDAQTGILFAGDNISATAVALVEWNAGTVSDYCESLQKMEALHPQSICTGHKPNLLPAEAIGPLLSAARAVLDGATPQESHSRNGQCLQYPAQSPCIRFRADNIR